MSYASDIAPILDTPVPVSCICITAASCCQAAVMIHPGYRAAIVPGRGGRVWGLLEMQMKVRKVFTIEEMTTTR